MQIIHHEILESTSDELRRMLGENPSLEDRTVVVTREQSKGRGQGDHIWYSTKGKNLLFSILIRHDDGSLRTDALENLMNTISVSICKYLISNGIEPRIKYPNDIMVADRKICGILIENFLSGKTVKATIVGIGLDINEENWPQDIPGVSLSELTGKTYDTGEELEKVLNYINETI